MQNWSDEQQQWITDCFPTLGRVVYANHAAMSPWPLPTSEAVAAFAKENAEQGPLAYPAWLKRESALRDRVARLLNAPSADDIALTRNTSEGVCIVANGVDWRPGDNLVTASDEFPTNRLAWEQLRARGVEVRGTEIRGRENPEAELLALIDARTRVLTVSSVQFSDGLRLDLARLGAACRGEGVLFFVDAIQEFGALLMDVQASRVDCLAAGSHKWQMGPEGMGVFYCREAVRERLALTQFGWRMLEDPYRFEREGRAVFASARRFEPGSPNNMGQVALEASLSVLERFGLDEVGRRVQDNSRRLAEAVDAIPGLALASDRRAGRVSGIVSLRPKTGTAQALHRELKLRHVSCVARAGLLRLSPHFYQHGEPMDTLLNALEDAASKVAS